MKKIIVISIVVLVIISTLGMTQSIVNQIGTTASDSYRVRNGPTDASDLFVIRGNTGNIGMGITSPLVRFHVYGAGVQRIRIQSSDNQAGIEVDGNSSDGKWVIYNPQNSSALRFHVLSTAFGNGPRMTILANGNVGIGTTIPDEKLHIAGSIRLDGGFEDKDGQIGTVGQILSSTGTKTNWISAPSVTGDNLGNHIATQNIRLNSNWLSGDGGNEGLFVHSSGRVGVGTAFPASIFEVQYTNASTTTISNGLSILNNGGPIVGIRFSTSGFSAYSKQFIGAYRKGMYGIGDIVFLNRNTSDPTTVTMSDEKMRITQTGNVGIGTINPLARLHLKGTDYPNSFMFLESNASNDAGFRLLEGGTTKWHIFNNGATNRFEIRNNANVSGLVIEQSLNYVGIGTPTPFLRFHVVDNASNYVAQFENRFTGTQSRGILIDIDATTPGYNNVYAGFRKKDHNWVGYINGDNTGGINYATVSDARLKMNIIDYPSALDKVLNIRVRQYEMKSAPGKKKIGFIAQELQKIYPQAVSGNAEDDVYQQPMGIDYGKLTPLLVKAIQELQAEIEILKRR